MHFSLKVYFSAQGMSSYAQFCMSMDLAVAISDTFPGIPINGHQILKDFIKNMYW